MLAEDVTHRVTDLAGRRVRLDGVDDVGHEVLVAAGGLPERVQALLHVGVVPLLPDGGDVFLLAPFLLRGDLLDVDLLFLVDLVLVDADDDPLLLLLFALALEGDVLDLPLHPLVLDGLAHPAAVVDLADDLEGLLLQFVGQALDVVTPSQRVDRVGGAGLVGEDLLGAQGRPDRLLGRDRQRLVLAVGVEALGATEDRRERLVGDPDDVVVDLLGRECRARRLGVELQLLGFGVLGAEPFLHDLGPHSPGGAELCDLLEDVVVGGKEERQLRREVVDVQPGVDGSLDVRDPVAQREGDLLGRGRAGLADVVAGDGDRVEVRHLRRAELEDVGDDPHRRPRRVDVGVPGDVLLEHVVLDRAPQLRTVDALFVADGDVHREQHRGGRVDGHRRRDFVEGDPVENRLHVVKRVDGDAGLADLARRHRVVGVVAHLGRQVEGRRKPRLTLVDQVVEPFVGLACGAHAGVLAHRPQPTAVHRRVDTPGVRLLAREAQVLLVVQVGDVGRGVQRGDFLATGVGVEGLLALAEPVEHRRERLLLPGLLPVADGPEVVLVEHDPPFGPRPLNRVGVAGHASERGAVELRRATGPTRPASQSPVSYL